MKFGVRIVRIFLFILRASFKYTTTYRTDVIYDDRSMHVYGAAVARYLQEKKGITLGKTCRSVFFVHHKSGLVRKPCSHGNRLANNCLRGGIGVGEITFRRGP